MVTAIIISVVVMIASANKISLFVNDNPTIKILALSFLILVSVILISEGFDFHFPKGYIYFAMLFSFSVELINMKMRKRKQLNKTG